MSKKQPVSKKWTIYETKGDKLTRKNRTCPKCGPCVFLAKHADRLSCGKCGYMERQIGAKPPIPPQPQQAKPQPAKPQQAKPQEVAQKPGQPKPKESGQKPAGQPAQAKHAGDKPHGNPKAGK
ncbi:MAG: 30S ribosomal protein S27ae [Candidatus Altiarchaeales archaeon IMC4]|nr:MAG: 30S ribosomal protein S27ae [Candidatus Altiarchaeales archaeon IMC4]